MPYRVLCDGFPLYDLRDDELTLTDPKVKLSDNSAGSFSFVITSEHPNVSKIQKLKSVVQVFKDDNEIFCGRVTEEKKDFYNQRSVYCEGELNYFVDSIQRPAEYHDQTVRGFLQTLVSVHNSQVEASKQFTVGAVTVTDSNDSLYRYTNYETTLNCISEKLVKKLGGHLQIRKVNGVRYLDYLADYPVTSDQVIEFGVNLLNYSENTDASDIATAVIPLGAKLDEADRTIAALDERITIKSVNDNLDYLYSQSAVDTYGLVFKVVTFDDVTVQANLKSKGQDYLNNIQFEKMTLDLSAIDLHDVGVDIDKIEMLNLVRVKSNPHGLDRFFPVTEMEISIDAPENNTLKLGEENVVSMTTASASSSADIIKKIETSESDILQEAKNNASQLIKSATQGHVVTTANEQLIMDTNDVKTAIKVWRWNLNGLGYSKTGYEGLYNTAITIDGAIIADFITAGTLNANIIKAGKLSALNNPKTYFDLSTGKLAGSTLVDSSSDLFAEFNTRTFKNEVQRGLLIYDKKSNAVNIVGGIARMWYETATDIPAITFFGNDNTYFQSHGINGRNNIIAMEKSNQTGKIYVSRAVSEEEQLSDEQEVVVYTDDVQLFVSKKHNTDNQEKMIFNSNGIYLTKNFSFETNEKPATTITTSLERGSGSSSRFCITIDGTLVSETKKSGLYVNSVLVTSDRNKKKYISSANDTNALSKVKQLNFYTYKYKKSVADDGITHFGMMADEVSEEMTTDKTSIDMYGSLSIALKAIQELNEEVESLKEEIKNLKKDGEKVG